MYIAGDAKYIRIRYFDICILHRVPRSARPEDRGKEKKTLNGANKSSVYTVTTRSASCDTARRFYKHASDLSIFMCYYEN